MDLFKIKSKTNTQKEHFFFLLFSALLSFVMGTGIESVGQQASKMDAKIYYFFCRNE